MVLAAVVVNGTCGLRFLRGDDFCPHGFFVFCFFVVGGLGFIDFLVGGE